MKTSLSDHKLVISKAAIYPIHSGWSYRSSINLAIVKYFYHTALLHIIQLVLLSVFLSPAFAQVKFYSLVSENQVSYNQTFQVQYVIEGAKKIQEFTVPEFKDFQLEEVFELPATPALDPKTLKLVDQHSKIVVLTPVRTGVFIIPGASAVIDGKKVRSNPVKVNVKASALSRHLPESAGRVIDGSELLPGEDPASKINSNFFVRAEVSKPVCFTGEPILATYKAYSRLNANSHVARRPSFTGFSVLEMVDSYDGTPTVEQYNGNWYYVHLVRKVQLFPLQEGNYELDPAEIEGTIHFIRYSNNPNGPSYEPINHPVSVSTQSIPVTVLPLPDSSQPDIFSGAVGQYSMTVKVAKKVVRTGELIHFQLVISGSGNIPLITAPVLNWPESVDVSEPEVKESINKYSFPVTGSKTFTYSLVCNKPGIIQLPPVKFAYFDPISKTYKTLQRDSLQLNIQPARGAATKSYERNKTGYTIPRELIIFSIIAAIILVWILIQFGRLSARKSKKESTALEIARIDIFEKAREFYSAGNDRAFYSEVLQQLCGIAGQKCQVEPSQLNKKTIRERFLKAGIDESELSEFIALMEICENALYGISEGTDKHDVLKRVERIELTVAQIVG